MGVNTNEVGHRMFPLPRTLDRWPWPRVISPYFREIQAESDAWFFSFDDFSKELQQVHTRSDFCRLCALAYPFATREQLRIGCDLMGLFLLIEVYTEKKSATVVRELVDIVIDAMHNTHQPRPDGEVFIGEVARQFWARGEKIATGNAAKHMLESFTAYLNSCVDQAANADNNHYCTVEEYWKNRRENIGARPSYVPMELFMDIPDEIFYHPVVVELSVHVADLIILDNDIVSYNKEQAIGDERHNFSTVLMHQFNIDLDSAVAWVFRYHRELQIRFLDTLKRVPSWEPDIDKNMGDYIYGLANWPRANYCWNFECERYFGKHGSEFQRTGWVPLFPKIMEYPVTVQIPSTSEEITDDVE